MSIVGAKHDRMGPVLSGLIVGHSVIGNGEMRIHSDPLSLPSSEWRLL